MLSVSIVQDDVLKRRCDLLVLKHADGFHGVDEVVARRISFRDEVGKFKLLPGKRTKARQVLFIGVGPLGSFRYREIRQFGRSALKLAGKLVGHPRTIAMTIHGPGYGLDEGEAFLSLVGGLLDAVSANLQPASLETLYIVEQDSKRVARLRRLLASALEGRPGLIAKTGSVNFSTSSGPRAGKASQATSVLDHEEAKNELADYGTASERKLTLFVAMPLGDKWTDEYEIAMVEAAQHAEIVCERIDHRAFVGDITSEVRKRIASQHGMIALLNGANPNVFLEIGYAWGKGKPTILLLKKGQKVPFDIGGHKRIVYNSIVDLRNKLKAELKALKDDGTLQQR